MNGNVDAHKVKTEYRDILFRQGFKQARDVSIWCDHPEYDRSRTYADAAVLMLESPLILNEYVSPICLSDSSRVLSPNDRCLITGWGTTEFEGWSANVLQEAVVPIVSREQVFSICPFFLY